MLPALHVYPPSQPSWEMKPVRRSLGHHSPCTSNRSFNLSHRKSLQSPTPCTILRPPSPHTPTLTTQPLRSPLSLPSPHTPTTRPLRRPLLLPPPQTPTQNSELSPALTLTQSTDNPDHLVAIIKSSDSVQRCASDAFMNGEWESQRCGGQAEVRYSGYAAMRY